jgi:hypothetical protein
MSKSLRDVVAAVSGKPPASADMQAPASAVAPSRQGKKGIVVYVSPEAAKEIRMLALELGSSVQALGVQAWNDLLAKHNRRPIA